jgi:choline dehydrogenase
MRGARHVDTIVIGAGSAGCVIASRLTERADQEVLLLEAGPDYARREERPRDLLDGTRNSYATHDWGYAHRPSAQSALPVPMPRGRVVGGSSAVNTCIALRGVPEDYDEWAERGLPQWSWERCLPAFRRLERDLDFGSEPHHGDAGPLPVRRAQEGELVPWQRAYRDACLERGFPAVADHNRPGALGVGPHTMNVVGGVRQDAASCWLGAEVRAHPNLAIEDHTLVHRVLFRGSRAIGVEVERHGVVRRIGCRRVVLSAGALASPALLMRSGVGPRAELARLGVKLVRDVPAIGAQLLDHPGTAIFTWPRGKWPRRASADGVRSDVRKPLVQIALRLRSKHGAFDGDLQIQAGSFWFFPIGTGLSLPGVSIMMHVGKPVSRGSLRVTSADPRAAPVIESRFFEDARDRDVALEGLGIAHDLLQAPALRELSRPFWPRAPVLRDRARLEALLPRLCDSGYHPSGTVPMGEAVDAFGRVDGLEGLHVADASLMPTIPTANIHLAVLMIGERFGQWLRDGLDSDGLDSDGLDCDGLDLLRRSM